MDLQSTAALVTICAGVVGIVGWAGRLLIRHRHRAQDANQRLLAEARAPLECELVPIWFEISLTHSLPEVMVVLQAVNYFGKELMLDQVNVEYFHLHQGPPLENIPATDVPVPAHRSRQVYCRRKLLDSEIRAFGNCPETPPYNATIRVSAKGHVGKKSVVHRPGSNFVIHGHYQRYG